MKAQLLPRLHDVKLDQQKIYMFIFTRAFI